MPAGSSPAENCRFSIVPAGQDESRHAVVPRSNSDLSCELDLRVSRALRVASTRISFLCEADGTIAWVSDTVERMLGYRPAHLVGMHFQDLYAPEDRAYSEQGFATIRANPTRNPLVFLFLPRTAQVRHADGHHVTIESHATPCLHDGAINAVLMEWHLVADRRRLLRAIDAVANSRPLQETQTAVVDLIESLLPGVDLEVLAAGPDGWLSACPPRHRPFEPLTAALPSQGDPLWLIRPWITLDDRPRMVQWARPVDEPHLDEPRLDEPRLDEPGNQVAALPLDGADGAMLGVAILAGPLLDGIGLMIRTVQENLLSVAIRMLVLSLAHDQARSQLEQAAQRDSLTGLFNRAGFDRNVQRLLADSQQSLGVLFIDLDDFKPVNDTYGHAAGDELLHAVARRIEGCLRENDVLARLGGDEFAVLCPTISTGNALNDVGRRILNAVASPFPLSSGEVQISASVGGAVGASHDLQSLLLAADTALYRAKHIGKSRFALA